MSSADGAAAAAAAADDDDVEGAGGKGFEAAERVSSATTRKVSYVSLECGYNDVQQLQKIEVALLRALAAASTERASGEFFSRPASIVGDVKKEMVDYLNEQSHAYAMGVGEWNYSSDRAPSATVDDMLDAFVRSKRNLFRRVSSKIGFMENNEHRLDEFVGELERAGVWTLGQREILAKVLLKRIDVSKTSHCERRLETPEELAAHKNECLFRPLTCENSGCGDVFSALHAVSHDAECPFKLLPCKQSCDAEVMRAEMESHCTTVCPMKLVNCPFASVGCLQVLPQGSLEQHCNMLVSTHLMFVLQSIHRQEVVMAGQAQRVSLLEKSVSLTERSGAADVNSLSLTVREQHVKITKLEEELKKLRKEFKSTDVSAKVSQLEKDLRIAHKQ